MGDTVAQVSHKAVTDGIQYIFIWFGLEYIYWEGLQRGCAQEFFAKYDMSRSEHNLFLFSQPQEQISCISWSM